MFPNQKPRPYVATWKLPSGDLVTERVTAFDVGEALMQSSVRLTSRGIAGGVISEIGPDLTAIEREQKVQEKDRAVDAITNVLRREGRISFAQFLKGGK